MAHVSVEHRAARARVRTGDVLLNIMAPVEHQRRISLDADIADTQNGSVDVQQIFKPIRWAEARDSRGAWPGYERGRHLSGGLS